MGVQDYAVKVIRNNRRLAKRNSFLNYFSKNPKFRKGSKTYSEDKFDVQKANKVKRFKLYSQYILMLFLLPLALFICFEMFDKKVGTVLNKIEIKKIEIKNTKTKLRISIDETESYNLFVSSATRYLKSGNMQKALENFMVAKNIFNTGKRANFGITLCLLRECKMRGTDCELSDQYFRYMLEFANLDDEEMKLLEEYK